MGIKEAIRDISCGVCSALTEPVTEHQPEGKTIISADALVTILAGHLLGAELFISDNKFLLPTYNDVAWFLAQDDTNGQKYEAEWNDCDDFALRLAGQFSVKPWSKYTFGLVWTDVHALNCMVTEDLKFYFVEPQTDEILSELASWQGSKFRFVLM